MLAAILPVLLLTPQDPPAFGTARLLLDALDGEFRGVGDFDGDGDVDLLHFTGSILGWTGVRLFTNTGAGTFTLGPVTPFAFPTSYTSGTLQPFVGDFNGDGNLDFVIARRGPLLAVGQGLEFFLGDGAGGWSNRILLPMTTPVWIAIGNIDADPALEVAVDNIETNYERRLGWVDFQTGTPVRLPYLVMTSGGLPTTHVFTVADVDGNGSADIVATATAAAPHDTVQFLPTVAGTPTLGSAFPAAAPMQNINHRIHAGDLDGDGDTDLLVVKMGSTDVGPWVQPYERTANGWLQRPAQAVATPVTGWLQASDSRLTDWNGDGWLDVVTGGAVIDAMRSLGNWQFAEGFEAMASGQAEGGGPCDVDGDGHMDVVNGITVIIGDGTFDGHGAVPLPFAASRFVDRDGDADIDLESNGPGPFARNNGTGAFAMAQRSFPSILPNHYAAPMAVADFDGNGFAEYLVMYYFQATPFFSPIVPLGMLRIEDDATDSLRPGVPATVGADIIPAPPAMANDRHWGTGDVDGDGDIDLLLDGGYRENDGTGLLPVFVPAFTGRGREVADFNGDAVPDVVTTAWNGSTTSVVIWRGSASGFSPTPLVTVPAAAQTLCRDLDGDGDADLLVAAPGTLGLYLFHNAGGTLVPAATAFPMANVLSLTGIGIGDIDGDGIPDLMLPARRIAPLGFQYETAAHFRGTGTGLGYTYVGEHLLPYWVNCFVDIDADGDLDGIGIGVASNLLRGTRATASGAVRQYGTGGSGSGGITPLLGARGPIVSTSSQDELRITRGTGGAAALLVFGLAETTIAIPALPGMLIHVGDPVLLPLPPLQGSPGVPGAGSLVIPLPNLPWLAGWTIVHQVFAVDAGAPSGWVASNGLALIYGS